MEAERSETVHTVWLGEEERIASFHPVAGYRKRVFGRRDLFLTFLQSLQQRGYCFQ